MKHRIFSIPTVALSSCLLLFACQTGDSVILQNPYMVSPGLLTSAHTWYDQHIDPQAPSLQKFGKLPLYWNKAWVAEKKDSNLLLVVPAKGYNIQNENFSFKRFVIFTVSNARAENGKIIELVGHHYNVEESYKFLIKNYDQPEIARFNGSIMLYDVSYRDIKSITYREGHKAKNIHSTFISTSGDELKKLMGKCA